MLPPISPKTTAPATTIGNGTSRKKIATNDTTATPTISPFASAVRPSRTVACATIATTAAATPAKAPATHRRSPCVTKTHESAMSRKKLGKHERDPRDETPSDPMEQPPDVGGELHRFRSRKEHAVAERVQEPPLVDPPPTFDELLVHQ